MDSIDKPSKGEDEYFAKQEIERRKKWAVEQSAKMAADEKQNLKDLHFMKCPKCGMDLHPVELHGIKVDVCGGCNGTWFDAGEIEQMLQHESSNSGVLGRVMSVFR